MTRAIFHAALASVFGALALVGCGGGHFDNGDAYCGDGVVDEGEACDGSNLAGESCESLGFEGGALGCMPDCSDFDTSLCYGGDEAACGNNVREGNQACDGTDLGGRTCEYYGYSGGTLTCLPDCSGFDTALCHHGEGPVCGNDTREGDQVCDGTDLGGQTCQSQGYDEGTLACLPDCTGFDTSGCFDSGPVCGNDIREGDEVCDGTDLAGQSCQSLGYDDGALACLPDCTGFDTSDCRDDPTPSGPAGTCGSQGATSGWERVDLDSQRYYFVRVPQSTEPLPMVMVFHGDGTDPNSNDPVNIVISYWAPVQDSNANFILVGMKCPGCASWLHNLSGSEQYIWDVLGDLSSRFNIDVSRVYASGYSGGANMLARVGLKFQGVFAGIHFNCGGGYYGQPYHQPPRSDCKVPARFVVSESDFLYGVARSMETFLLNNGHHVDFLTPSCSGHCCHIGPPEASQTLSWFLNRTKCGGIVGGSCAEITALP